MAMDISNINNREFAKKDTEKDPETRLEKPIEKEVEIEKPQEKQPEKQQERQEESWPGRVQNGDLYCLCEGDHKAMCLTVKFSKANKGRKCRYLSFLSPLSIASKVVNRVQHVGLM